MNEDKFEWTENLIKEMIYSKLPLPDHYMCNVQKCLDEFKKSKQSTIPDKDYNQELEILMKPIYGYENYFITNDGNIWNSKKERFLKLLYNDEYQNVGLYKDGESKTFTVHRLVADYFIPNPDCKPCVNHKNGIKTDNHYLNLEWATSAENNSHAFKTGLRVWKEKSRYAVSKSMGGKPFFAENGDYSKIFFTLNDCAKELSLNDGNISKCLNGIHSQSGGYKFRYCTNEEILLNKPIEVTMKEIEELLCNAPYDLKAFFKSKINL